MQEAILAQQLATEYDKASASLFENSPTVVLLGPTGAGKSSLVNALFGKYLAPVSDGTPCTQSFNYFPATPERPVHLYDSKGLEPLDGTYLNCLKKFIHEKVAQSKGDITKGIHCVWYVLNTPSARWSDGDTRIVRDILKDLPTVIVLNKCDIATAAQQTALKDTITRAKMPSVKEIVCISARPQNFKPPLCPEHGDNDLTIRKARQCWECNECGVGGGLDTSPQGIDDLVQRTVLQLPEMVKLSFLAAQDARLESKKMAAYAVVITSSLVAYGIGWSPIPFSDAPLLVGVQAGMAGTLAAIFGIVRNALIPVMAGQFAAFGVGLGLASLLKVIPGVGTLAGGFIDSTIAFVCTLVIGILYTSIFSVVYAKVGYATAEERTSVLLSVLKNLDIKNLFLRIS